MNYTPQTEVHLLSNVPFNFSYNNVMDFDTLEEQTAYFLNKSKITFDDLTHQRVNNNSINLEIAYEDLYDVNYMMFQNDKIQGKWFYAFITNYDFVSPNVTRITYQIDVYQTWLFDMIWQTSYIEREHTKRYNDDGTPIINTIEENLNYGSDYQTIYKHKCNDDNIIWLVAITKKSIEAILGQTGSFGRIGNIYQPLHYTLIPVDLDGNLTTINGKIGGDLFLMNLGDDPNTVGQLVSLFYTPYVPFEYSVDNNNNITTNDSNVHFIDGGSVGGFYSYYGTGSWITQNYNISNDMYSDILPQYEESKLLMYPYTVIELTDMKGNTATLKPQNFSTKRLSFDIRGCISSQPKTAIYPRSYLGNTSGNVIDFTCGIINNNICDIPIVDDYTASYMQANRNSIATTNKYAMDNALRGVSQNSANNRLNNAMLDTQQKYNQLDMYAGMASNALSLNLGGVINSAYQSVKAYDLTEGKRASMNLNNEFANKNLMINAEQAIGLTQAKIQDINNIPPTVSNLGNNTMFDTGWKNMHFYVIVKTVRDEYAEQLTNYFKMFGYKVNKLEIPNTKSRENYNYIKSVDANIIGNIPSSDLSAIKGIFDKGVTIWHTDNVGDYSLSNDEVDD